MNNNKPLHPKAMVFFKTCLIFLISLSCHFSTCLAGTSSTLPDLTVASASLESTTFHPKNNINFECTIQNVVQGDAGSSRLGIYLSTDTKYGSSDIELGDAYTSSISGINYKKVSGSFTIPENVATGTYYILFYADHKKEVSEGDENNNTHYIKVTIPHPDITVKSILFDTPQRTGLNFSIQGTLDNSSTAKAGEFKIGFYISTDNLLDDDDILIGDSYQEFLFPGEGSYYTVVTMPSKTSAGDYFIIAKADYLDHVTEVDETNNIASAEVSVVVSNLAVYNPSVDPVTTIAGNDIEVSSYILNDGDYGTPAGQIAYYLSSDNTYSSKAQFIGAQEFEELILTKQKSVNNTLTIPLESSTGTQYILFYADYNRKIAETDETDNVTAVEIFIEHPDLEVLNQFVTPVIINTNSLQLAADIKNIGKGYARSSELGFYLSSDNLFDQTDEFLAKEPVEAITEGSSQSVNSNITLPSGLASGTYYIIFVADYSGKLGETDKDNNNAFCELSINYPDLEVSNQSLSVSDLNSGDDLKVFYDVKNIGIGNAESSQVDYYLSADQAYDETDVLLGSTNIEALTSGALSSESSDLIIPNNTETGSYCILVISDLNNTISENNDDNNRTSSPLTITLPKYVITTSATPEIGGTVSGSGIHNQADTCYLAATVAEGYNFINWTENNVEVSTDTNYSFEVIADRKLAANFEIKTYDIEISNKPSDGGTVEGAGTYQHGGSAILKASPNTGYIFTNWIENGNIVSEEPEYSFTVTSNRTLAANFEYQSRQVSLSAYPEGAGTLTGEGTYGAGEIVTVSASEIKDGYQFINWTENDVEVSTNADYTFTITEDIVLVANFERKNFEIEYEADTKKGGEVYGPNTAKYNEEINPYAWSGTGYSFVNWTLNDEVISTDSSFTYIVKENLHFVAHFEIESRDITVVSNNEELGTVTGSGTYNYNEKVSLTATPAEDCEFVSWTSGFTILSVENPYLHELWKNAEVTGNFQKIIVTSIDEPDLEIFKLYPNPVSDVLNIELNNNYDFKNSIEVVDIKGMTVYKQQYNKNCIQLDVSSLKKGMYIIKVIGADYIRSSKVLIN
ncbi:CARDB domain-containing protein [Labilibaculum manganireducens]|uniref:CARDB domain-containing protein n=1 Tax=Labilibaculum manganireducens TaxID=1940525 RepID=UPI0029F4EC26|nr:CARDB domain-containing protein [Labilibaculum manganireducens]